MVTIIRNGVQIYQNQSELQVGDLVQVDNGMEVPADGVLVQAAEILADESAMTGNFQLSFKYIMKYIKINFLGETLPIKKDIFEQALM